MCTIYTNAGEVKKMATQSNLRHRVDLFFHPPPFPLHRSLTFLYPSGCPYHPRGHLQKSHPDDINTHPDILLIRYLRLSVWVSLPSAGHLTRSSTRMILIPTRIYCVRRRTNQPSIGAGPAESAGVMQYTLFGTPTITVLNRPASQSEDMQPFLVSVKMRYNQRMGENHLLAAHGQSDGCVASA